MGADDAHPEILALDPETGSIVGGIDATGLRTPHALAFDDEGHLWVTDDGGNRVVVFDEAGRVVRSIGGD
jgi:DNA-binding beta-propeller fold protein YncE